MRMYVIIIDKLVITKTTIHYYLKNSSIE